MQPVFKGLFNVSYYEKEVNDEIISWVGEPFGFITSLKMGGSGSPRMIIQDASEAIQPLLSKDKYIKYCNIEIRPKGLILRFRLRLDALAFVVSYKDMEVVKTDSGYMLRGHQQFFHLIPFKNVKQVAAFFVKIQRSIV